MLQNSKPARKSREQKQRTESKHRTQNITTNRSGQFLSRRAEGMSKTRIKTQNHHECRFRSIPYSKKLWLKPFSSSVYFFLILILLYTVPVNLSLQQKTGSNRFLIPSTLFLVLLVSCTHVLQASLILAQ